MKALHPLAQQFAGQQSALIKRRVLKLLLNRHWRCAAHPTLKTPMGFSQGLSARS